MNDNLTGSGETTWPRRSIEDIRMVLEDDPDLLTEDEIINGPIERIHDRLATLGLSDARVDVRRLRRAAAEVERDAGAGVDRIARRRRGADHASGRHHAALLLHHVHLHSQAGEERHRRVDVFGSFVSHVVLGPYAFLSLEGASA